MPASDRATILVIDDDIEMTEMLTEYLEPEGFAIEVCHDGESGLKRALQGQFLLVVLDVMLPRLNGFEVLRRLRGTSRIPVLMLTARGDPVDRVTGLETGADDYLPKPFDPQELTARVRAILRRTSPAALHPEQTGDVLTVADVVLDSRARTVRRGGSYVDLTADGELAESHSRVHPIPRNPLIEWRMWRDHGACTLTGNRGGCGLL